MKTKQTHIAQLRHTYASNQQRILAVTGWSIDQYTNHWLDLGTSYLHTHYPEADARYADVRTRVVADNYYWRWWLAQYKRKQAYFLKIFTGHMHKADAEAYERVMACLLACKITDKCWYDQYLLKTSIFKTNNK